MNITTYKSYNLLNVDLVFRYFKLYEDKFTYDSYIIQSIENLEKVPGKIYYQFKLYKIY